MKRLFQIIFKKTISLRQGVFYLLFSISFLSVLTMSVLWIVTEVKNNKKLIHDIKKSTLQKQEKQIKNEAANALSFVKEMGKIHQGTYEKEVQQMVLDHLQHIRFGYAGYIFVNTIEGKALIFDGKKMEGEKSIKNLTVAKGLKLFQMERKAALKPGGGYVRYLFKKMNDTILHPKISFITYYKPWGWMIGAGDYLDEAQQKIQSLQSPIRTKIRLKISSILLVLLVSFVLLLFLSDYVAKQFVNQPNYLIRYLKDPTGKSFDTNKIFIKEVKIIAKEIIDIQNRKTLVENELREHKEHLEELVKKRTEELNEKNKRLENFHELFIWREFRIKELRDEIKKLKQEMNIKDDSADGLS